MPYQYIMKIRIQVSLSLGCLLSMLILSVLAGSTYNSLYNPTVINKQSESILLSIESGWHLKKVSDLLHKESVISNPEQFEFVASFLNWDERIQAGHYKIESGLSNFAILSKLVSGETSASMVTIPEGYSTRQIAGILQRAIQVDSTEFMLAVKDTSLLNKYEIDAPSFEGFLFPDSYNFHSTTTIVAIIDRMVERFRSVFEKCLDDSPTIPELTLTEIVTLAAIIQGEMQISTEAPDISSVYNNRLKNNMKLQADPTIQYIIRKGPRRLYNGDLAIQSPYNTYIHNGLPPGPVNNPGRDALYAALNPSNEPYLYMVARGDGTHAFNVKFSDHLRDKDRLDSLRRVVARDRNKKRSR